VSWQAVETFRDRSQSRGATRTVGFVLASYADKFGGSVYPSLATIEAKAHVGRKAAVDARRWLIESGEAEVVGQRRSGTPELSLAPLFRGLPSEPPGQKGVSSANQGGSIQSAGGSLRTGQSSPSEPEPEVETEKESENETKQIGPSFPETENSNSSSSEAAGTRRALREREELTAELDRLRVQLPSTTAPLREQTMRSIATLEAQLAVEVAA
jgi:hypothetical protein